MATPLPFSPLFRSLLAALVVALPPANAREPKVAPVPPQPVEAKIKARRGETVEIPLRIYGTRAQTLTFLIRTPPRAGKLSAPKNIADESAVVRYTPPTDHAITRDSFTYAVRSVEGVGAAAEVKIEIIDTPAELNAPVDLKNTRVLVGESETLTLELANRGGEVCEGEVKVEPPWRVEAPGRYRIEPGGRAILHLTFAPDVPGEYRGEVKYSTHPDRVTTLSGEAVAPLALRPAALELKLEAVTGTRTAAFEITNNTNAERSITIHAADRLKIERRCTLAPGRSAAVTVLTAADDTEAFAEVIRFEAQGFSAVLPVRAAAVPPPAPPVSAAPPALAQISATPPPSQPERPRSAPRTTPVVETPPEDEPEPDPASAELLKARFTQIIEITTTSATIEWPAGAKPETCHAEVRALALRGKQLDITWPRFADFQATAAGDKLRGTFTKLTPGGYYAFRIVAPVDGRGTEEVVAAANFGTRALPPRAPFFTWPRALGVAFLGLLGRVLFLRLRASQTGL